MIVIKEKSECTGCSACKNICPKRCIEMKPDSEGFCYPVINKNLCINCSMCEKVCPLLSKPVKSQKLAYAAYSTDETIRKNSSSGGVFSVLALKILSQGGIVFGAAFDGVAKVKHIYIDNEKDLCKLRTSKYIQSEIGDSYKKAKEFLDKGRLVLFSGTPCQIAGLNKYLIKSYDNLYSQDVICHGVPSQRIWDKYIKSKQKSEKDSLISVNFRNKDFGWKDFSLKYQFSKTSKNAHQYDDLFFNAFLNNIMLRPSCYECRFKDKNYYSDLTLGDFWGIQTVMPEMDDNNGTSLIICNTDKGKKLLTDVSNSLILKKAEYDEAIKYNSAAIKSVNKPGSRDLFFKYLKHHSILSTLSLFCGEDKRSQRKVQLLEDYEDVKTEKGRSFSLLWLIKNKLIQK